MLYAKRERFNKISNFCGRIFSKICSSPNIWTAFGIIPAVLSFYFLVKQNFLIAAGFFILTAIIDFIDGSVARVTKRVSNFGAYLDTVVDRVTEFIILFGLYLIEYPDILWPTRLWLFFLLFGSLMTTYVKSAAFEKKIVNKEIRGGILERGERMMLLLLIIVLSNYSLVYAAILIMLTTIVANLSALQRFIIAIKQWGFA
jgi:phosphatidylglycerophosphate synthase